MKDFTADNWIARPVEALSLFLSRSVIATEPLIVFGLNFLLRYFSEFTSTMHKYFSNYIKSMVIFDLFLSRFAAIITIRHLRSFLIGESITRSLDYYKRACSSKFAYFIILSLRLTIPISIYFSSFV